MKFTLALALICGLVLQVHCEDLTQKTLPLPGNYGNQHYGAGTGYGTGYGYGYPGQLCKEIQQDPKCITNRNRYGNCEQHSCLFMPRYGYERSSQVSYYNPYYRRSHMIAPGSQMFPSLQCTQPGQTCMCGGKTSACTCNRLRRKMCTQHYREQTGVFKVWTNNYMQSYGVAGRSTQAFDIIVDPAAAVPAAAAAVPAASDAQEHTSTAKTFPFQHEPQINYQTTYDPITYYQNTQYDHMQSNYGYGSSHYDLYNPQLPYDSSQYGQYYPQYPMTPNYGYGYRQVEMELVVRVPFGCYCR